MTKYRHSGRSEQTKAAVKRLIDAKRLQANGRWRGAMYLAGYYIECKLKTRLMEIHKLDRLEQLNQKLGQPVDVFTHSIEVLFELTGARSRLVSSPKMKIILAAYRQCNQWTPAWRYKPDDGSEEACCTFMDAVEVFGTYVDNNT